MITRRRRSKSTPTYGQNIESQELKKMGKNLRSREPRTPAKLNRAGVIGAIAGCTIGFGALATAPNALADTQGDWWLFTHNNTSIFGTSGNGNTTQLGGANGNIINGQFSVPILSAPVAAATNAAAPIGGAAVGGTAGRTAATRGGPNR